MVEVNKNRDKAKEEYYFLIEKLEEVISALKGSCNDIDCDKYIYRDILRKKYKPTLQHSFSCLKKLQIEKEVLFRILSQKKYVKFRFKKCSVCKKKLDTLSEKSAIVAFTRLSSTNNGYEWNSVRVHKLCKRKFKVPLGWNSF